MRSWMLQMLLLGLAVASACNVAPDSIACTGPENDSVGEKVLKIARSMIGRPYRYRGETPVGFDCSGLVRYSYMASGIDVPHATIELKAASRKIDSTDLREGDLVFFQRNGKEFGHVGLYAGDDLFIHAPSRGKSVRIDSLQDPYWKQRFSGARRF
jgi:cell wall-associated NlpC family hydrolase